MILGQTSEKKLRTDRGLFFKISNGNISTWKSLCKNIWQFCSRPYRGIYIEQISKINLIITWMINLFQCLPYKFTNSKSEILQLRLLEDTKLRTFEPIKNQEKFSFSYYSILFILYHLDLTQALDAIPRTYF